MASDAQTEAEILSQNEIEAILSSMGKDAPSEAQILSGKRRRPGDIPTVQAYDFRSPVFLSPERLRRLRIKHEEFIRALSARLSTYLRMEFAIQMSRLETIPYRNILENIPMPSHLTLFRLKPLAGMCLLDVAPRLGLTVLDRMMGGPGHSIKNEREFTDIEIDVLNNFIQMILKEYADSWLKFQKLEVEIIGHENTARFLNLATPDDIMMYLEMEARFGDVVAGLRFVFPFSTIEGLIESLMQEIKSDIREIDTTTHLPNDPTSPLYQFPVPVSAHWKGFTMTLRELKELNVGDVLFLDNRKCEQAIINLGALSKFVGAVHTNAKQQVAVRIISKMETQNIQNLIAS